MVTSRLARLDINDFLYYDPLFHVTDDGIHGLFCTIICIPFSLYTTLFYALQCSCHAHHALRSV